MRIYLCSGHGGSDPGAIYFGRKESDLTFEFALGVYEELSKFYNKGKNLFLDKKENSLKETLYFLNAIEKVTENDIAIDFHFNASDKFPSASGCEVFVPNNPTKKEVELAEKICYVLSSSLKSKNRGVKKPSESNRGNLAFLDLKCNTVLVEIEFMSNKESIENYEKIKKKGIIFNKFTNVFR